ncbi:3-keto-steroid reductase [Gnomoniopsis smithogilvyi]|uniref:3-keto-steroid reductase n=1 Tax=Gnomoniopsis smithogilvyi TaxID=1191159 RepID=A0A9W8YWN2_9PEZI|nr:3-keto-steroid reductase [Gnomoniopsis smithogilvyi]
MAPAPWASLPAQDTLFVLVTGANSGVGLGICERTIDTFLTERPLTSHLVLLPTTRSARKAAETVASLRQHVLHAASTNKSLKQRGVRELNETLGRVHVASVQLDLCDLSTVRSASEQLVNGTLYFDDIRAEVKIPRLDAVIFNAGIGGWSHVSWLAFAWDIVTEGWIQATTRPTSKRSVAGLTVNPLPKAKSEDVPALGLVFCANVLGHYLFAHYLLPLLSRKDEGVAPGRIIWQSSVDPSLKHFDVNDIQGLKRPAAYESSKFLTDVLALTADLPSVRPRSAAYFKSDSKDPATAQGQRPNIYLAHPGIVATTMFPLHFMLMWGYVLGTTLSRWLGSPWHPVTPYKAGMATTWLALASQETLDAENAQQSKWGSCTDFWGNTYVKKTEVDGWGWEGRVESAQDIAEQDRTVRRVLRKSVGRKARPEQLTEEKRAEIEEIGAKCWEQMEKLREEWEERLIILAEK